MAVRTIRKYKDEILRKKSKKVEKLDGRILTLLDDMAETMYEADGVGLAGPQVGVLRRIIVVDTGEGLLKLINPEVISYSGEQVDVEGCLSIPNIHGEVPRPENVIVRAVNEKGEKVEISAKDLQARALCHEIDHLNGVLFIDKVTKIVD